jgi:eukaryotic-like serine/threonine-protein kinase
MLDMELAEGLILDGHYRLRQLLGRGGMGEVWEAEHTRLPKQFAIKFLLALSKSEPELLMRFQREAEIASRLAHPSIVQVTDFNILADGTAYIVMERLVGEDLRARLSRGPVSLAEVREIARQVASALQLAHQQGIVHRDLKPENIFLCHEPDGALRAKVLDFGISKLQGSLQSTRDDRVLGTPGYMAPEQAMGKNSVIDGRTDVFALATIVYEMLTGQGVFMGDTLAELCTKVLYHHPPPLDELLPGVPRPIAVAVAMALSKDPAARQTDIRQFSEALGGGSPAARLTSGFSATVASDAGLPALPVDASDAVTRSGGPQPATPSQPVRSRGRALGVAAACIVAVLAAGAWWQVRQEPRATQVAKPPAQPVAQSAQAAPATREPAPARPVEPAAAPAGSKEPELVRTTHKVEPRALDAKPEPALSAQAREALDAAERALAQGQPADALRLARGALREASSERAYTLMARAYCGQRDVGMVQAMLRNLSPAQRKQVRAQCLREGLRVP